MIYLVNKTDSRKTWARLSNDSDIQPLVNMGMTQVSFWGFWAFRLRNWM